MATLDELRRLATVLPPNFRVTGTEVADVVSALVAVAEHGQGVVEAADQGKSGDFFYEAAKARSKAAGDPEPQRGNPPVEQAPAAAQPTTGQFVTQEQLSDFLGELRNLTSGGRGSSGVESSPAPESSPPDLPPVQEPVDAETESDSTSPHDVASDR